MARQGTFTSNASVCVAPRRSGLRASPEAIPTLCFFTFSLLPGLLLFFLLLSSSHNQRPSPGIISEAPRVNPPVASSSPGQVTCSGVITNLRRFITRPGQLLVASRSRARGHFPRFLVATTGPVSRWFYIALQTKLWYLRYVCYANMVRFCDELTSLFSFRFTLCPIDICSVFSIIPIRS